MSIRAWGALAALMIASIPAGASAQSGWGQLQLVNQTSQGIDLYVDGQYGCRALSGLTCETMVREGGHTATAQGLSDGQAVSQPFYMESGGTFTYTITEE